MALNKRQRTLIAAALAGPVALPVATAVDAWMVRRAAPRVLSCITDLPHADAALVLGARVDEDGEPLPPLEDRLRAGELIWRAGLVPTVVATGDDGQRRQDEVGPMVAWLRGRGVPKAAILPDSGAFRTLDSLVRAKHRYGLRRVIVCTQRDHLPRALYLADAVGLRAVGFVADGRFYEKALRSRVYEWAASAVALADVHLPESLRKGRG